MHKPVHMPDAEPEDLFDLGSFRKGYPKQDKTPLRFDDAGRLERTKWKHAVAPATYEEGVRLSPHVSLSGHGTYAYGVVTLGPRLTKALLDSPDGELPHLSLLQDVYIEVVLQQKGSLLVILTSNVILGSRWLAVFQPGSTLHPVLVERRALSEERYEWPPAAEVV